MKNRRQFVQSFVAAVAAQALPFRSWAWPPARQPQLPVAPPKPEGALGTVFKIIGLGGAGCNAVEYMIASGVGNIPGIEFICADTDAQSLRRSRTRKTILLGESGHSTDGNPDVGRTAAEDHEPEIRDAIGGANMLFITAGMGGGLGTGAAPVFGRIAREMGIQTVGMVTLPFEFEGDQRKTTAIDGLAGMQSNVNALVVMPDEELRSDVPDSASQSSLFACANNMLKIAIGNIVEVVNVICYVNVDFEDVLYVMNMPGIAIMGTALASGPDRGRIAATNAIAACQIQNGVELSNAEGILVTISGSKGELKYWDDKFAVTPISEKAAPGAHFIYGMTYDESLGDKIRVTIVATGLMLAGV